MNEVDSEETAFERAALESVLEGSFRHILIASDLHLGIGRNPETEAYWAWENFVADEAFGRWLESYGDRFAQESLLVLNGDVFDFLRIVRCPRTTIDFEAWALRLERLGATGRADQVRAAAGRVAEKGPEGARPIVSRSEEKYGLRTDDYKTLWRLHLVIEGHGHFFGALARWNGAGGSILFVKGNHDVEMHWQLVRRGVRDELARRRPGTSEGDSRSPVAFVDDAVRIRNLHIEHGHQHDPMTAVLGNPILESNPSQINLPLGSFVNRYLINILEYHDPFLDNIKPVNQALLALLRKRPLTIVNAYLGGWKFLAKALGMGPRRWLTAGALQVSTLVLLPPAAAALVALFYIFPGSWPAWIRQLPLAARVLLSIGGILSPLLLPFAYRVALDIKEQFGLGRRESAQERAARAIFGSGFPQGHSVGYVVMGHTHQQGVSYFGEDSGPEGKRSFYLNTGTWIPSGDLRRDSSVGASFSFARFDRKGDGYEHAALIWDDEAKEERPALLVDRSATFTQKN